MKRLIILLSVIFLFGVLFPSGAFSITVPWEMMDGCFKSYVSSGNLIYFQLERYEWYKISESMCKGCYLDPHYFLYYQYFDPERHARNLPACKTALYDWHHVPVDPPPPVPGCNDDSHAQYENKKTYTQGDGTVNGEPTGLPGLLINLANLNFVLTDTDLAYPDHGRTIQIARTYNAYSTYEGIFGRGWTFNYGVHLDIDGSNVTVVRGSGAEKLFTCPADGTCTPPKAVYDKLTKNLDGTYSLWTKRDRLTYAFTATGVLSSVTDSNGNAVTLAYNGGLLSTITDASGRTISFSNYNAEGQVRTITDPLGRTITFAYVNGNMHTSTDLAGVTTTFSYGGDNLLSSMTISTPSGDITTSFAYHDYGWGTRLETVTDAEGNETQYSINVNDMKIEVTDPLVHTTRYGYYYDGDILYTMSIIDPLGNSTYFGYDNETGNCTAIQDANGKTTTISYDDRGNITGITNALEKTWTITYAYDEEDDHIIKDIDIDDPLGRNYHFDYDDLHDSDNLTMITDPLENETEIFYAYYPSGHLEQLMIRDARNKDWVLTYDDQYGYLRTFADPLEHEWGFTYYDLRGKLKTATDPLGNTTEYEYDDLGRLTRIIHPDETDFIIHRYFSGIEGITDENDIYTGFEHDNINQLEKIIHALTGYETDFGYDEAGNLTSLFDPKDQETIFEYFENDRLKKTTYPEGVFESYTYYPVGSLETLTDANGALIHFEYDDVQRLTSITHDPDLSIGYTYDDTSKIIMTDATGTTNYEFDEFYRLEKITYPSEKTIDYTYDAVGNITSIATPFPFGTVNYGYYDNNLLHFITLPNSQQVTYQYDAADNLTRIDYPNGTYTVFAYDTRNRLTNLTNYAPGDTVISTYAYTLDGVGNRTDVDQVEPLIHGFDPITIGYNYNLGNILASGDEAIYTHDDNGNRTQKVAGAVTVDYTYDPLNRLTQVADGTQTTQYIYNGLGHRVGKVVDGVQTNYLIDPNGILPQVLAEMDANNDLISFYVYDGVGLVAKITPTNEYYFYHYDSLGSTVAITDESANVVNKYAYSPYGMVGAEEDITNPFTYVGYFGVMTEGNGLYYMRARYYDPGVGRFINKDPIGYTGGINLYWYVRDNPIHYVDPDGLRTWGFGYGYVVGFGYARRGSVSVVIDDRGSVGILKSRGGGGMAGATASIQRFKQKTTAKTICDLQGISDQIGGSLTISPYSFIGPSAGVEEIFAKSYQGETESRGLDVGLPFEFHLTTEKSKLLFSFNIFDWLRKILYPRQCGEE